MKIRVGDLDKSKHCEVEIREYPVFDWKDRALSWYHGDAILEFDMSRELWTIKHLRQTSHTSTTMFPLETWANVAPAHPWDVVGDNEELEVRSDGMGLILRGSPNRNEQLILLGGWGWPGTCIRSEAKHEEVVMEAEVHS